LGLKHSNVHFEFLDRACFVAFVHLFHALTSFPGFLIKILFGSDHDFTVEYFFLFGLKSELDFFEEMFKFIVVTYTLFILAPQTPVQVLQLLHHFFLLCVLFLLRDEIFEHVDGFDFERSFVLKSLIVVFDLLGLVFELFLAVDARLVICDGSEDAVLRLLVVLASIWQTNALVYGIHLNKVVLKTLGSNHPLLSEQVII
jgi:hypothetical protein